MQARTPVDTGNLKSSESVDVDGLRFEAGPTADYGEYVELGTSRMAAEPYAGPAFDQELPGSSTRSPTRGAGSCDAAAAAEDPRKVLGDQLEARLKALPGARR
jgi:hypothetical protein